MRRFPESSAALRLIKPITWFPPMWAYVRGLIASGAAVAGQWHLVLLGVLLAGPIVCGMSQAAKDWCDRHVDAINEPDRPIPSGRIPGRWGLWIALMMSVPQAVVIALLFMWDRPLHAAGVAGVLLVQFWAMTVMFKDPKAKAPWYNGTGVLLYVSGMMIAAFALRGLT